MAHDTNEQAKLKKAKKLNVEGDAIRQLADILVDTNLTEIEYEDEGRRIRVARQLVSAATVVAAGVAPAVQSVPQAEVQTEEPPQGTVVHSPVVGVAYLSSEPGAEHFVKVGDIVEEGQTLMIIEAMKVMNPIKSPKGGKVLKILAEDGHPVEYDQPLLALE